MSFFEDKRVLIGVGVLFIVDVIMIFLSIVFSPYRTIAGIWYPGYGSDYLIISRDGTWEYRKYIGCVSRATSSVSYKAYKSRKGIVQINNGNSGVLVGFSVIFSDSDTQSVPWELVDGCLHVDKGIVTVKYNQISSLGKLAGLPEGDYSDFKCGWN